jgi:predicted permease
VAVRLPGQDAGPGGPSLQADCNEITQGYFETLAVSVLRGRNFSDADRAGAPLVAILNQTLARRVSSGRDPLGMRLLVEEQEYEVVGVVKDMQYLRAGEAPEPFLYRSYWQTDQIDSRLSVRVATHSGVVLPRLRREIHAVDPNLPIAEDMTLPEKLQARFSDVRLASGVLGACAMLALLLSLVGLYAVLAWTVGERTREIGIRVALGARRASIRALVLRQGLRLLGTGLAIGVLGAWSASRVLARLLYGVSPDDPVTFVAAATLLSIVAIAATIIPARRATLVDPMVALRCE